MKSRLCRDVSSSLGTGCCPTLRMGGRAWRGGRRRIGAAGRRWAAHAYVRNLRPGVCPGRSPADI